MRLLERLYHLFVLRVLSRLSCSSASCAACCSIRIASWAAFAWLSTGSSFCAGAALAVKRGGLSCINRAGAAGGCAALGGACFCRNGKARSPELCLGVAACALENAGAAFVATDPAGFTRLDHSLLCKQSPERAFTAACRRCFCRCGGVWNGRARVARLTQQKRKRVFRRLTLSHSCRCLCLQEGEWVFLACSS